MVTRRAKRVSVSVARASTSAARAALFACDPADSEKAQGVYISAKGRPFSAYGSAVFSSLLGGRSGDHQVTCIDYAQRPLTERLDSFSVLFLDVIYTTENTFTTLGEHKHVSG